MDWRWALVHPAINAGREGVGLSYSLPEESIAMRMRGADMNWNGSDKVLRSFAGTCILIFLVSHCLAQSAPAGNAVVPVLMVSDIHFEPFWDPAKAAQLAAAPASGWDAIFAGPASADREQRFASLQQTCHARGTDTSYPLLTSSLAAMRSDAAGAKFITVSGDLIAHSFACKYRTLLPQSTPDDYTAFVEKTLEYVADSLRGAFPGVPVYAALGNNDTDCGDYQLDANSKFLAEAGRIMAADFKAGERREAQKTFAAGGYFSASLPAPMRHTRLLVLDDLFMGSKYSTCSGKPDPAAAAAQIAWLEKQLDSARRNKEKVWVMAHIPPGVNPYSTAAKGTNICAGKDPQMFLSAEDLPDALAEFGDVIQLGIFAHTHMDELRLLEPSRSGERHGAVPVKMVASISPIDGNNPSFTVARVDPDTAIMTDYRVYAASNKTGVDTTWAEEYDYAEAYREPSFSGASVEKLVAAFKADARAQSSESRSYIQNYFIGDRSRELTPFWPMYVCALSNHTADSYRACVCAAGP